VLVYSLVIYSIAKYLREFIARERNKA